MTIQQLYAEAVTNKEESLILLLDFLLFKKKVIKANDDISALNKYFEPRFKNKMNEHLKNFNKERVT